MITTVIYIRVSTEDQAKEGYSLEVQREYLDAFVMHKDFEIFKIHCIGGINDYYPEQLALKKFLKNTKDTSGHLDIGLNFAKRNEAKFKPKWLGRDTQRCVI